MNARIAIRCETGNPYGAGVVFDPDNQSARREGQATVISRLAASYGQHAIPCQPLEGMRLDKAAAG